MMHKIKKTKSWSVENERKSGALREGGGEGSMMAGREGERGDV